MLVPEVVSPELVSVCNEQEWDIHELATSGGEDFELLFTGPKGLEKELCLPLYPIGQIVPESDLTWRLDHKPLSRNFKGYKHF